MRLSIRESIKLCRVGYEDAMPCGRVRRPALKQFEQVSGIGHLAFDTWMRPVAAPHQTLPVSIHQRVMKWPRIGIVRRAPAEAMGTRQLGPAPAIANRAQQALEAGGF